MQILARGVREALRRYDEEDADNRTLECAAASEAQALVTGNFKHIRPLGSFRGIEILTPAEFLSEHFPGF